MSQEDLECLRTLSRLQRAACEKWMTQRSYIRNRDVDRMASLKMRNEFMAVTFSKSNKAENEKERKASTPSDSLPEALINAEA